MDVKRRMQKSGDSDLYDPRKSIINNLTNLRSREELTNECLSGYGDRMSAGAVMKWESGPPTKPSTSRVLSRPICDRQKVVNL